MNEITLSASLSFSKGAKTASFKRGGIQVDMSGTDYVLGTQTATPSAAALNLGGITTPGLVLMVNNDATNFVEIRDGSGGTDVVKIMPGEAQLFRLATSTPFVIADTANVELEYLLIEA